MRVAVTKARPRTTSIAYGGFAFPFFRIAWCDRRTKPPAPAKGNAMTGMILILLGLGSFAIWFVQRQQAQATMRWPSVAGVIRDARVMFERDAEGRQSPTMSISY